MISTHVLDLSSGKPAAGVYVLLARVADGQRDKLASGVTDSDGRIKNMGRRGVKLGTGVYELTFETGAYFASKGVQSFHPVVTITIELRDTAQHYHVPLLLSPFGYTTYRGS